MSVMNGLNLSESATQDLFENEVSQDALFEQMLIEECSHFSDEQMKMFLTRLGNGSKIVVTGDLTQTDLPDGKKSGLAAAVRILKNIEGIAVHEFSERDVVRHRLVQKIIMAYDRDDRERRQRISDKRPEEKKRFHAARVRKEEAK